MINQVALTRGRHAEAAVSTPRQVIWRFVKAGRPDYAGMLLSDHGRMILTRKYDAFTTDYAYPREAHGSFGLVGRAIDAYVLSFPLHEALRQRLALVEESLAGAISHHESRAQFTAPVKVLSVPCGLARDVIDVASTRGPGALRLVACDIDEKGDVLPEVRRRAIDAGVEVELLRQDIFAPGPLDAWVERNGGFDVVNCIGLTAWMDLPDAARLLTRLSALTARGGILVVDNWRPHKHSHLGKLLEIPTRYHDSNALRAAVRDAGYEPAAERETPNGIVTVLSAVKVYE